MSKTKGEKKEINFWPYTIVGMILTVVMLASWTIKVALENPVQLENSYMMKYQDVDDSINDILMKQKSFDAKFNVDMDSNKVTIGKNRVQISIYDIDNSIVDNAKITALVTRPDTTKYDIQLPKFSFENGRYISEDFNIERAGRWNIVFKIEVDDELGYKTYKAFIR